MVTEKGYIGQFSFVREETGFYVFNLVTKNGEVVCVGNATGFSQGETVEVTGEYVDNPLYGKQIKISSMVAVEPDSELAMERYLGSGAIKGIGEALAKRIVEKFGDDTFRIAIEEPEKLSLVKGISINKAYDIGNQIAEKRDARDAMIFLQKYGISLNLANKIYQKYGLALYEIIRENPYKLAEDIKGVGFKIADDIAAKSGIQVDSDYRIRCGLLHVLMENSIDGHTYCPMTLFRQKARELLGVTEEAIDIQADGLAMERRVVIKGERDEKRIYLGSYYYEEAYCAKKLIDIRDEYVFDESVTDKYIEKKIDEIQENLDIILEPLQRKAVADCAVNGVYILSGGPGTGKTTTINAIINYIALEGLEFCLAAPTGRAAKRMTETTGYEAKTIHRLLENSGALSEESGAVFNRNEENPLEADVIIIDEMSMVDIHLFKALLQAIVPGTKLILVGDVDQLSSVGPGEVLRDVLESEAFATTKLEKIFRQDESSHIISNAYKINSGTDIDFSVKYEDFFLLEKDNPDIIYAYIEKLLKENIAHHFGLDPLDTQILTPMRNGKLGVLTLNKVLQARLNPPSANKKECTRGDITFRTGDKVMQIKNNYEMEWEIIGKYNIAIDSGTGIYNGDVGRITEIDTYMRQLSVLFDDGRSAVYSFEKLEELELAYAITIHKSQGSEYPVVIIPVLSGPKMLLTRNLLYTAVTRSQQCVILIGSKDAFLEMIHTDQEMKRYTSLKERIVEIN